MTFDPGFGNMAISYISKATGQIVEPPGAEGTKICSNTSDHMTNMATMPIYGKNLYKSTSEPIE